MDVEHAALAAELELNKRIDGVAKELEEQVKTLPARRQFECRLALAHEYAKIMLRASEDNGDNEEDSEWAAHAGAAIARDAVALVDALLAELAKPVAKSDQEQLSVQPPTEVKP